MMEFQSRVYARMTLPEELNAILTGCDGAGCDEARSEREILVPHRREEILKLAMGGGETDLFEVAYDVPGKAGLWRQQLRGQKMVWS